MRPRLIVLIGLFAAVSPAQLTTDQRLADFRNLGDLYARRYAAIQWKKAEFNFDALNLAPWMARVSAVQNDLDFYDLLVEYVSDLQDAHDQYNLPSDFEAHLGFTVDIYDGKVLVDSIDRTMLPDANYPFQIGDQLVSVDGQAPADLIKLFSKYVSGGNSRTVQRFAAELITDRYQAEYPRAHQIGDTAAVVVLRQSGATETYSIPWQKMGLPLTVLGPSPGPRTSAAEPALANAAGPRVPFFQTFLQKIHNYALPGTINVLGFDELRPIFTLPDGFVQRLGKRSFDSYYSGTYKTADGTRIGYLRIPDFEFPSLSDLDKEIRFFQNNVDVLVVDVMRNPGGSACSAEEILSRFATMSFQGTLAEIRTDWTDITEIDFALADAQANEADPDTIAQLQLFQTEFQNAFMNNGGRTKPLPICASTPARDPASLTLGKPVLLLVDEMSASSAEIFASLAQDNNIATLFGYRTMGAGGSPDVANIGIYTEGATTVTRSLVVRSRPIVTTDYPTSPYLENVGVRPETTADYMTADNLTGKGATFVSAFTAAAVKLVNGGK